MLRGLLLVSFLILIYAINNRQTGDNEVSGTSIDSIPTEVT